MNAYQTEYFAIWKNAFAQLLGWSEAETIAWAKPLLRDMDPPGMVINEPPLYYVARELAWGNDFFDELTQSGRHELIRSIEFTLSPSGKRDISLDFDFHAAKAEIDRLICAANPVNRR